MKVFDIIKKGTSLFTAGVIACAISFSVASAYCPAEVSAAPVKNTVTDGRNYSYYASTTDKNYIVPLDDGGYMTFVVNSGSNGYTAEYFNKYYESTGSKSISAELGTFGAFYSDANGYYILTGQNNTGESASVECFRLTKYDKSWNRKGSCGLKDCNTTYPFSSGSASMTSSGNFLVIRTCHKMYKSSDGYNHQANVTILVNTQSMTILDSFYKVSNASDGYSSHSFNQYVRIDNNHIIGADHGDAYPRCMGVWYYKTDLTTGKLLTKGTTFYKPFPISGEIGANQTGATLGGLEISDTSYIIVGSSIVQGSSTSGNKNIFVSTVNKSSGAVATKWLTSDAASKGSYSNPYIVKVSNTKFAVIWSRSSTVYYAFIDDSGDLQGSVYTASGSLSDCQPVLSGNKIIWFTKGTATDFIYIDLTDNSFNRAFTVTVESSKHGTATVSPTKALTGKQITITAKPDEGYEIDVIRVNGTPIEGNKFEMPGKDTTVSVFFKKTGSPSIGDTVPVGDLNCQVTNSDTDGAGTVVISSVSSQAEYVVVPATVEINGSSYKVNKIAARAFFENASVKTVYIGPNVTVIDTNAFFGCPNLVKVSGGAGLKSIGQNAFARCPKLSTFIITSKVLYKIGPQAFYKDSRLKTIYIKNTTKLTKSGVKKSLKGSSVKTVKVKKSKIYKYRKFFKKSNSGRKVKVKK